MLRKEEKGEKNTYWHPCYIRVLFLGCKMMEGLTLIGVFQEGTTLTC
jgi:hypothetical protein